MQAQSGSDADPRSTREETNFLVFCVRHSYIANRRRDEVQTMRQEAQKPNRGQRMLKTHRRGKLLNAVVYFAANTLNRGKTKLFKLLYLLDFEHFKATGRSVTGLDYYAWTMGPVPVELNGELDEPCGDLFQVIRIEPEQVIDHQRLKIVPQKEFDPSHFSRRELRLLAGIAEAYRHADTGEMVEATHAENGAWDKVWRDGVGQNQKIDYSLALDGVADRERIEQVAREYDETLRRIGTA